MVSEEQVENALKYLASTDEQVAQLKGHMKAAEHLLKVGKAMAFLKADGNNAEREAAALTSDEYAGLVEELENAVADYETIHNKRERAVLTIEVWRSENASRRQGM